MYLGVRHMGAKEKLTVEQQQFIRENVGTLPIEDIASQIDVTNQMVTNFCKRHDIDFFRLNKREKLSQEDKNFIQENKDKLTITEIAQWLGRHPSTIFNHCKAHNIDVIKERIALSDNEITFIYENKETMTVTEIAKALNKSVATIHNYCKTNEIKVKGPTDIEFIKANTDKTAQELAVLLDKDVSTINAHCRQHNIKLKPGKSFITDEEKQIILENTDKTAKEIAELIFRTPTSIHHFCKRNCIEIRPDNKHLISEETKKLVLQYASENMKAKDIAELLGISIGSVNLIKRMNIEK